jgi:HEPN domain-containing protein
VDVEKAVAYWTESAKYDLETGSSLLDSGRYPYALFFGHLTLEKILKAIIVKNTNEHAPYTHSLTTLALRTGLGVPEDIIDNLAEFTEFHLEARYPDEKGNFHKKCTKEFAYPKFTRIKEVYEWFNERSKTS